MRILICIASMELGGAERQVTYLSKAFLKEHHKVDVALLRGGGNLNRLIDSGASIHYLKIYPANYKFVFPIINLINKVDPAIIYIWQRPFDVLASTAALLAGRKFVIAERTNPAFANSRVKVFLRNIVVPLSSGIITNSKAAFRYWNKKTKENFPIKQIPNIIPFSELNCVKPFGKDKNLLISVGRLDRNKNTRILLKAIKRLRNEGIIIKLSIVGDGELYTEYDNFIQKNNLINQITLYGHDHNAWRLMKSNKYFVSMSLNEGEPNAVLEAAALGCKLLLSDIPSHRLLFQESEVIFVDPQNEESIIEGLKKMLVGKENRKYYSKVFKNRDSTNVVRQHINFFSSIINNDHKLN